ncbi:MAG: DUF2147 domain-containing protein [Hyphomicrobiaceae bacterium]|nr:DUF2147 domain-containing protein [Hyphomicrobiaceae bacterium]
MSRIDQRIALRLAATGIAGLAFALSVSGAAQAANDPTGVWLDNTGRGAIEIKACGKALCGHVVWVSSAKDRKGCGEQIIGSVKPAGGGRWDYGWIYSPQHGRKFDVELKPLNGEKLRVMGYAGMKLFSETRIWRRAPADLVRCDAKIEAAAPTTPVETAAANASAPAPSGVPEVRITDVPADAAPATRPGTEGAATPENETAGGNDTGNSSETAANDDTSDTGSGSSSGGLGGLQIDKFLKKTANGNCKLDLPWVKIAFSCKNM